jgi:hypothetical protein
MVKVQRTKRMVRTCTVCGKKIRLKLYQDGHYKNGHYFGTLKVSIGKGEYKKVGNKTKVGKEKVDVVKWTGKEKEVEYWECDECFDEAIHESWLEDTLEKLYGAKCKDYEKNCACCQAWNIYETIKEHNREEL